MFNNRFNDNRCRRTNNNTTDIAIVVCLRIDLIIIVVVDTIITQLIITNVVPYTIEINNEYISFRFPQLYSKFEQSGNQEQFTH